MAKIFIADCEPEINKSLKGFFEYFGYDTYAAEDIENLDNIIREIKNFKPNIVLLDVRINKVLRLDVIDRIKELENNIKVIVMSTYGGTIDREIINEIMAHGTYEYLQKPFAMERLIDAINRKTTTLSQN